MRAILLLLILLVVIAIAAVATGFININQVSPAQAPEVDANRSGVAVSGGRAPRFDVETGKVAVGARERTVKLPSIEVRPAEGRAVPNGQQPSSVQQPSSPQQPAPAQQSGVATTNSTQP